ncbi:MAG: Myo-inositol 2-dehydrogenase, partial [Verrucomicrobiales bacterium]|nr:Myo-inositol 2-dehydrogenase [Verrucomicrobiales bacterium]
MKTFLTCLLSLALLSVQQAFPAPQALALHSENPHYFLFHGEPTVLVTSGEHYGAVLNLDFNYLTYLNTLRKDGLNLTRTFTGAYVEPMGAFNIAQNTLAPKGERFICPWARSSIPGYANGGNKFDLSRWDDAYFKRLN